MATDDSPSPLGEAGADPVDDLVTTWHTLRTAAGERPYTAVAGRVVLRREKHTDGVSDLLFVDLLFVDPVSTGYSRAVSGGTPAVSYGTLRAAALAGHLRERHGMST